MDLILTVIMVFIGLLIADLMTACVHWVVDNYASRDWPFVGKHYVAYAHDHHDDPLEILRITFLQRHWFILTFAAFCAVTLYLLNRFNVVTTSALIFGAATNYIHCLSHRTRKENGPIINFFHHIGLLQSPKNHTHHHNNESSHYALLTDYLNPIIEASRIFPFAERCLLRVGLRKYWWDRSDAKPANSTP